MTRIRSERVALRDRPPFPALLSVRSIDLVVRDIVEPLLTLFIRIGICRQEAAAVAESTLPSQFDRMTLELPSIGVPLNQRRILRIRHQQAAQSYRGRAVPQLPGELVD